MEIKNTIEDDDVEWVYTNQDKQEEFVFEKKMALAHLLMNGVVFLNSFWWEESWPEECKKLPSISVNCNDIFLWGCADGETLNYSEIEDLYKKWKKDPSYGPAIWCIIKRKQLPQKPVEDSIRKAGIWDLDALTEEHQIRPNRSTFYNRNNGELKYKWYSDFVRSKGEEPKPFDDKSWWGEIPTGFDSSPYKNELDTLMVEFDKKYYGE
jgi:hypothetical protein